MKTDVLVGVVDSIRFGGSDKLRALRSVGPDEEDDEF